MESKLLSVDEVASRIGVSPQYVRKFIKNHQLQAERIGKQWIISEEDLNLFLNSEDCPVGPPDQERKSETIPDIVALSFFSGAMGLDIGIKNGGITPVLACEKDKYCRMTIKANEPDIALIGDINNYTAADILRMAKIPEGRKIDLIIGGPPCQAFSTAGARRALDDERGNVFLRYIELVSELKPLYVVIENVRGLLSAEYPYKDCPKIKGGALCIILDKLKEAGYTVSFELYNAANFGAPQIRERVVLIGKLNGEKMPYLTPTHSDDESFGLPKWKTFQSAVDDLVEEEQHYKQFPENRLKYYRILKEGQYWKDLPPDLQVEAMGAKLKLGGGKTGFFRRISSQKPAPTLVTDPTMPATDLCHPTKDRPLSVEEYRRIQGFPDSWIIKGPLDEQYKQIGNAVPIKLGEAISKAILDDMNGTHVKNYPNFKYSRYKNTSDITWQADMNKKISAVQSAKKSEQLSLGI